jgi:tetratricopeptide (TPR) repeat protein
VTTALDVSALWDFRQPALSEQRFRDALADARGDDVLILKTQIARTHGLRGDFETARRWLDEMAPALHTAGPEARTRHALELGRTWASPKHTPASQTDDAKERARAAYQSALAIAREGGLDGLAIDAIHMLAFVDTAPEDQLKYAEQALALVQSSDQAAARRWEASIRNNLGYALHQLGRYDEAMPQFERAVQLREERGDAAAVREARWMVAWTLRFQKHSEEALAMQLALERECDAAAQPDAYVFEELEILYRERGDEARARHYAGRRAAAAP